jgi:hypothetical protein
MNRLLLALCTLLSALTAHAQVLELSSGTFNNVFVAPAARPVAPGPPQTDEQFAAMGQVAGAVGPISTSVTFADRYPANADKSLVLATARVGTFYSQGLPLYFMGDQILPPLKQADNITNAAPGYWRAKPVLPGEVVTPLAEYVTVNTSSTSSPTVTVASVPTSLVVNSKLLGQNVNAIASLTITLAGNANATITSATNTPYRPANAPPPTLLPTVNVTLAATNSRLVTIAAAPPVELVVGATLLGQPITAITGTAVTLAGNANANINSSTASTITPATSYYYSVHAEKVFASQPGRVAITWVSNAVDANGAYQLKSEDFAVSSTTGADLPVRTIYWTEGSFDGPLVQITDGRITTANPVYNPIVPKAVAQEVVVPGYTPSTANFSTLVFEKFNGVGQLKAYNVEGRILLEYLGNVRLAGVIHEHVGLDVVDIKRTPIQIKKTVHLGQEITPHDGDLTLTPSPVLKGVQNAASFYGTSVRPNGTNAYFAEKATGQPFTPDTGETEPDSYNQVVFYWLQSGSFGIQWPKYQNRYWQRWSPNLADYAHYSVDPDLTTSATGISFTGGGLPQLVYQDDPAGAEAAIDVTTQRFFVKLAAGGDQRNRSLLNFNSSGAVWYVNVYTQTDTRQQQLTPTASGGSTVTVASTSGLEVGMVVTWAGGTATITSILSSTQFVLSQNLSGLPQLTFTVQSDAAAPIATTATVGDRIAPPAGHELAGYIDSGTGYYPTGYLNPFTVGVAAANLGAIIPVNALASDNVLTVRWFKKISPPAGSSGFFDLYVPGKVGRYTVSYPAPLASTAAAHITIAEGVGSGDLVEPQRSGSIYTQNVSTLPGFNPNEEHALIIGGRAYALRDDLNTATTSQPFVLLAYTAADKRPAMRAFKVRRIYDQDSDGNKDPGDILFNYTATAGTLLVKPYPLPLLPLPLVLSDGVPVSKDAEIVGTYPPNTNPPNPSLANEEAYKSFTFKDRKGFTWVHRGPHDAETPVLTMKLYYKSRAGFFIPGSGPGTGEVTVGTILPFLRAAVRSGQPLILANTNVGGEDEPLPIIYTPAWPANPPELRVGETLTLPKFGLPQVRGQTSAQVHYQQSLAKAASGQTKNAVTLHDPTRAKTVALGKNGISLDKLPAPIKTSSYQGRTYFQGLPAHLQQRFYFDPVRDTKGSLVLIGQFHDEIAGEDYLDLNLLTTAELAAVKALLPAGDDKSKWDAAIDALNTKVETFARSSAQASSWTVASTANVGESDLAEISSPNTAVDSYALTATGLGDGFVTLVFGNGGNPDLQPEGDPVQVKVIKVTNQLYVGDLKVVKSSNPLDEQVTLRHSGDYAGKPENYIFEWRWAAGVASAPKTYTTVMTKRLGVAGSSNEWIVMRDPGAVMPEAYVGSPVTFLPSENVRPVNYLRDAQNQPISLPATVLTVESTAGLTVGTTVTGPGITGQASIINVIDSARLVISQVIAEDLEGDYVFGASTKNAVSSALSSNIIDATSYTDADLAAGYPSLIAKSHTGVTFSSGVPGTIVLSAKVGDFDGFVLYVNGQPALAYNAPTPQFTNTNASTDLTTTHGLVNPKQFSLAPSYFKPGANTIEVAIYTTADPNAYSTLDFLIEAAQETDVVVVHPVNNPTSAWGEPNNVEATNTALVGGNPNNPFGGSAFVLNDRWFTMRYRAKPFLADGTTPNPAYALTNNGTPSRWMPPQFVEGWIKRVLAAINPFEQRVKDLYNNSVNTDVSVITQAGTRWEGDIALNMENINDVGLIAIYETVLNRAKSMSIDAGANDPDTNNALILAAGYLNDLYTIVGNEAFADAANPTISLDDQSTVTEVNTSRFSFEGQVSSSLDEELALLKGRDDSVSPGVITAPFYNRLVWNYTQGINSGQVLYAVNYNIKEKVGSNTADGVIDESDAQRMFPQGHGDAYGHYLTALTGYYRLVSHPNFNWQTRAEAVTVLGQPVTVDFQDERKFAAAAGNLARTAQEICALTYRRNYKDDPAAGWEHFRDTSPNPKHQNLDEWVSRSTQGALYHWAVGNALVPDVDPYHTGVQKIDRSTIPELPELATAATSFQVMIDNANARLNPLGLSPGAIAFDIDPIALGDGKTHTEQMYDRALRSLVNAAGAFNQAGKMTRSLRYQQNQIDDYTTSIEQQEVAFVNQLIDIFGRPYSGDVGPGKLYSQDYNGPDLQHWFIVDRPNDLVDSKATFRVTIFEAVGVPNFSGNIIQNLSGSVVSKTVQVSPSQWVQYNDVWQSGGLGTRPETGELQDALQETQQTWLALDEASKAYKKDVAQIQDALSLFEAMVASHSYQLREIGATNAAILRLQGTVLALNTLAAELRIGGDAAKVLGEVVAEGFPKILGLSNDATSAPRAIAKGLGLAASVAINSLAVASDASAGGTELAILNEQQELDETLAEAGFSLEQKQAVYEFGILYRQVTTKAAGLMQLTIAHQQALQNVNNVLSSANRILAQREVFRQRAAAIIQGYRTKDLTFRLFRNEALEQYRSLFDLASRYTYLAAKAYDYETGLLGTTEGRTVFNDIVAARSLGDVTAGTPLSTVSSLGDDGLAGVMSRLNADFSVAEGRLGINNPDQYGTVFSLRTELFRELPHDEVLSTDTDVVAAAKRASDDAWKQRLEQHIRPNVLNDADVATYCRNIRKANGSAVPGFIIPFTTTIEEGKNFFNLLLAGGDHSYSPASFATKIHSVGIALPGYIGMDAYAAGQIGSGTPNSTDPNALSATPYVYLIPCGTDIMRAPPLGDTGALRFWDVKDQALPLPYNLGAVDFNNTQFFNADGTLTEQPWIIRKHQPFRAVSDPAFFYSSVPQEFTNTRLIARSVWNTQWKIVIPAITLLNNEQSGLDKFTATVDDIQLFLRTYSHSGN